MTPAEAAELLAHCAAFDRRTIGEADARAWARALDDVPLDDDVLDAVAEHYAHTDQWITVAQIRAIRTRIRDSRIDAAHPVYDGDPDESPAEFTARRRVQLAAAADGELPARTITQAVGAAPSEKLLALLPAVGRPVDEGEEPAPYVDETTRADIRAHLPSDRAALVELDVDCPNTRCRAARRRLCTSSRGKELHGNVHGQRRDAYAQRHVACPDCDAPPRHPCTGTTEPHPARIRAAVADRPVPSRRQLDRLMRTPPQPRERRARHTTGGEDQ